VTDVQAVLTAFRARQADLPIDYDHQSLTAEEKAGPVPAAGWIRELAARGDGIWARVEWTPRAAELLVQREYRYLSPVFRYESQTGRVVELTGAGLTHVPNLHLTAVSMEQRKESRMLPERIARLLGVPVECSEDDAVAACQRLVAQAQEAAHARTPDPAQWVPIALHTQIADQLAELQAELARREAEAAVEAAMRQRKISPGLREWALAYAQQDPAGFRRFVAAAPELVGSAAPAAQAAGSMLSDTDRLVARLLGISDEVMMAAAHSQEE
jgi:phage I-like protein